MRVEMVQVNVHVYEKERWGGFKRISCFDVDDARDTVRDCSVS